MVKLIKLLFLSLRHLISSGRLAAPRRFPLRSTFLLVIFCVEGIHSFGQLGAIEVVFAGDLKNFQGNFFVMTMGHLGVVVLCDLVRGLMVVEFFRYRTERGFMPIS